VCCNRVVTHGAGIRFASGSVYYSGRREERYVAAGYRELKQASALWVVV